MSIKIEDKLSKITINDFKTVGGSYQALSLIKDGADEIRKLRRKLEKLTNDKNKEK